MCSAVGPGVSTRTHITIDAATGRKVHGFSQISPRALARGAEYVEQYYRRTEQPDYSRDIEFSWIHVAVGVNSPPAWRSDVLVTAIGWTGGNSGCRGRMILCFAAGRSQRYSANRRVTSSRDLPFPFAVHLLPPLSSSLLRPELTGIASAWRPFGQH